jgi:hypothetical protein
MQTIHSAILLSERMNQCVEMYIAALFICVLINGVSGFTWQSTDIIQATNQLNSSPFVVLYGHEPRDWAIEPPGEAMATSLPAWLSEQRPVIDLVHQHLLHAQQMMKKHANKKCSFHEFAIGAMVFLKLQSFIQSLIAL